jgi:hypothetical protein
VVELSISSLPSGTSVCARADGKSYPAQLEVVDNGKMRVWWIVSNLSAGSSRDYTFMIGEECAKGAFVWADHPGKTMDLMYDRRRVMTYMYASYNPLDIENTKKPYHQVFSPNGTELITKGVGGKYSHHRGIFYGYQIVAVGDSTYDIWHAATGEHSIHDKVLMDVSGPVVGGHTVHIYWKSRQAKPIIEEHRTIRAFAQPDESLLIEFESTLKTLVGPVKLGGDKQHAGVQFRAAQEVAEHEETTRFLRPDKWGHLPVDKEMDMPDFKDLEWNAMQYNIGTNKYSVAYLTDPNNPDNADFSERLYGRFGEFIPYNLTEDNPLKVRYRWWILASHEISQKEIELRYNDMVSPPKVIVHEN